MFKRLLTIGLSALLLSSAPFRATYSQTKGSEEPFQAEKIKVKIIKHGIGKRSRVEVRLKNNQRLKGYIGGIAENHFVLVNSKTSDVTKIPYADVDQLKTKKPSVLVPIALGAGAIGFVLIFVALALRGS